MIEVKFDSQQVQVAAAIQQINTTLGNPASLYQDIGEYLLVSTKQRFVDKVAPDGSRWDANSAITQARKGSKSSPHPWGVFPCNDWCTVREHGKDDWSGVTTFVIEKYDVNESRVAVRVYQQAE